MKRNNSLPCKLDRALWEMTSAFPQIRNFPTYEVQHPEVGVLGRIFMNGSDPVPCHKYIYMALWSMRSHILNSDMAEYRPRVIFYVEDEVHDSGHEIFEEAGVPEDWIVTFSADLCPTTVEDNFMSKAACALVDERFHELEHLVIVDTDTFSAGDRLTGFAPILDISLNRLSQEEIVPLRGWTHWDPVRDEYQNWYNHGFMGKQKWQELAAGYCDTTPEEIDGLMYLENLKVESRPFHNGAYINLPMHLLRDDPEFVEFVREVSGTMGNEEIAFAVWAMRRYLKTGYKWPKSDFQDYLFANPTKLTISWAFEESWFTYKKGTPVYYHMYDYTNICRYLPEWRSHVGASPDEIREFEAGMEAGINEALRRRVLKRSAASYRYS